MRGIIELPIEKGKRELNWVVGTAQVDGTVGASATNPVVNMTTSRDADFVAKRKFFVRWPAIAPADANLTVPADTSLVERESSSQRALGLVPGFAKTLFPDANPVQMLASQLGLPSPRLIKANTNYLIEVARPTAAGTAWSGDLFVVYEGFKVYPYLPEDIPAKIKAYSVDFGMNANMSLQDPSTLASFIQGQRLTISNDGSGKFLAKRLKVRLVDANGVDRTDALTPVLAFNIKDSTSGDKHWVGNNNPGVSAFVPVALLTMGGSDLFFNTPRYIDPNGVVTVEIFFAGSAAALAYAHGVGAWPMALSVSLDGSLLPI